MLGSVRTINKFTLLMVVNISTVFCIDMAIETGLSIIK